MESLASVHNTTSLVALFDHLRILGQIIEQLVIEQFKIVDLIIWRMFGKLKRSPYHRLVASNYSEVKRSVSLLVFPGF